MKRHWIWLVLLLALGIRLYTLFKYGLDTLTLHSDDEGYTNSARNLLKTGMLTYHDEQEPTVHIMPGQPFLLAGIFFLFGSDTLGLYVAKILMILIGVAGIYGIYRIGRLIWGNGVGLFAALCLSVTMPQVLVDNLLLTETPFTTSLIYLIYFSLRLVRERKRSDFYWLMLFYLLALMFRATIALYPVLLLGYLLLKKYPWQLMLKQAGIGALIVVVVLTPWWVRNYAHYNAFIPLTGGEGNPKLMGTFQGAGYPKNETLDDVLIRLDDVYPSRDAYTVMKVQAEVADERLEQWWSSDPVSYIQTLVWEKPKIFWKSAFFPLNIYDIQWDTMNRLQKLCLYAALVAMAVLFALGRGRRREVLFICGLLFYFTAVYSIYLAMARYNMPLVPFLYLLIGGGIYTVILRLAGLFRPAAKRSDRPFPSDTDPHSENESPECQR